MTDGFGVTKMGQVEVRPWNWASNAQIWSRYPTQVCPNGAPQFIIKMVEMGIGETAWPLGALAVPAADLSSVPSTHIRHLTTICNSSFRE